MYARVLCVFKCRSCKGKVRLKGTLNEFEKQSLPENYTAGS